MKLFHQQNREEQKKIKNFNFKDHTQRTNMTIMTIQNSRKLWVQGLMVTSMLNMTILAQLSFTQLYYSDRN